jgi:hypothetical protein
VHRSFASLRKTLWIYVTNLWDTTLVGPEGVSDGNAEAEDVVGVKLKVVFYKIIVRLRANEEASPGVVTEVPADVHEEMVAVDVGVASSGIVAAVELGIED